jgi:hypothetical protein
MTSFADLVQDPAERHIVYGGTRSGKSSFMDWTLRRIQRDRPQCMQLLLDTKPRFRAETIPYGPGGRYRKSAAKAKIYEHWARGPMLPNSVAVDLFSPHPFRGLWDADKRPGEIAILQNGDAAFWRIMNELAHHFVGKPVKGREKLLTVDEMLDFYQRNSLGIDPRRDVILRTARAGGEQNVGLCAGAHRPYGIPPMLNTLTSRVTLFHLRYEKDMRYLWDMGIPESEISPNENWGFKQYRIESGGFVSDPVKARCGYPDSYLKQLAST